MSALKELLDRGLASSRSGDGAAAMDYFQRALALDPSNFAAQYLMAAELAGAGQFEAAQGAFERALREHPEQASCRFQTGLLQITMGTIAQGRSTLAPLQQLPSDHYLRLFAEAVDALCADDLVLAEDRLRAGLARNSENPPLSADMAVMLQNVVQMRSRGTPVQQPAATVGVDSAEQPMSMAFLINSLHGNRSRH